MPISTTGSQSSGDSADSEAGGAPFPVPDDAPSAAHAARSELERWELIIEGGWVVTELNVVVHFDPSSDLAKRARAWNYEFPEFGLSDVAVFGAALAQAEADAWYHDEGHVATRALEDRRFLLGDRLLHWAVPWLAEQATEAAIEAMATLLALGEEHRVAPLLTGDEGMFPPGEDSYGPLDQRPFGSVWCGAVIPDDVVDPTEHLRIAQTRWQAFESAYPGSARLWHDLGERCRLTLEGAAG